MKVRSLFVPAAAAALLLVPALDASAAITITGTATAQAGNNGNPAVQQTVTATGNGRFDIGPLSGPQFGGNSTLGHLVVASQPEPHIEAYATGSDNGLFDANGGTTFDSLSYTFDFSVLGPQSNIAVPLRFTGTTFGDVSGTGDATRWNSSVGTRLKFASVGGLFNYAPVGAQGGTAPDVFSSSVQSLFVAWGKMAANPVNYTNYNSQFAFDVTVRSGSFAAGTQVLTLATILQGGTAATLHHNGLPSSSTAQSMLDTYVTIDPDWSSAHPGYHLVLDAGVGVGPVPEPAAAWLMLAGLGVLVCRRGWRRGNGVPPGGIHRLVD
jgi:hypothetical protein